MDGGTLFGVVPKPLWERQFPADAFHRVAAAAHCVLVRDAGFTALIQTGLGERWTARERALHAIEPGPTLEDGLAVRGITREQIDALVVTTLRFDHAGGATSVGEGGVVPRFPAATLYVQQSELARARSLQTREGGPYRAEDWRPYAEMGRLEAVEGEAAIRPGLSLVPLPGHAAGSQAVRIESEGRIAFVFGDALPTSAHVPIAWMMAAELYPVELIASKKRLLDRAAAEGWLCVFERDPNVPWGTLVDELDGRRRVHVVPTDREEF